MSFGFKFPQRRRLFAAGHGGHLEDDGPQFFLGNSLLAAEDQQQPQATENGQGKSHGLYHRKGLYFLDFTPSPPSAKVPP